MTEGFAGRYRGIRVAVTGGSGYLAHPLRCALSRSGASVLVVSRRAVALLPGETMMSADVRTPECWEPILGQADVIFHLAGNTSAYTSARDPRASLDSTVLPINHLLAAAARQPGMRVVYASTATVYGMTDDLPVSEDAPTNPVTVYDLHKLCAEQHLRLGSHKGLVEGVSLRLANVYGPSASGSSAGDRGVLNRVARLALQGSDLSLYGGGQYVRDYVYIDDVVRAFLAAGVAPGVAGSSFNVASGVGRTIREAFEIMVARAEKKTGRPCRIADAPWPPETDPIEYRSFVADVRRFSSACGWEPEVGLVEGVDRLLESLVIA